VGAARNFGQATAYTIPSEYLPKQVFPAGAACAPGPELFDAPTGASNAAIQVTGQAQDFLSMHAIFYGHFRPRRHRLRVAGYRRARAKAFRIWRQENSVQQVG